MPRTSLMPNEVGSFEVEYDAIALLIPSDDGVWSELAFGNRHIVHF